MLACHLEDYASSAYSHLAWDDTEECLEVEIFFARDDCGGDGSSLKGGVESVNTTTTAATDAKYQCAPGEKESVRRALAPSNPYRPLWVESISVERTRLLSYECWRKLSEAEYELFRQGKISATPTALLLNRKRCGRYKSRLIVLGDRWTNPLQNSCYASVVSQVGNRAALTIAAKNGFYPLPYDISNAFIRASMASLSF